MSSLSINGIGFEVLNGVGWETLDQMVSLGIAHKDGTDYELTEEGEVWLREWCAEQIVQMGGELQLPLDGMKGGTWVIVAPPEWEVEE